MTKPQTIEEFKNKYKLTSENLDDLIIELYDHSNKNNWEDTTFTTKSEDLKRLYSSLFIRLNEWLINFNLPIQNTITKAKNLLNKKVFASVVDVKQKNYKNLYSRSNLIKYLRENPEKMINKELAKDEGYRFFLEHLF